MNYKKGDNSLKIVFLFFSILFFFGILFFHFISIATTKPKFFVNDIYHSKELAIRGKILSKDHYTLVKSHRLYDVAINAKYIDFNKVDLFVDTFSLYTGVDKELIRKKIDKRKRVILIKNIDDRMKKDLKHLSRFLDRKGVFIPNKRNIRFGLEFIDEIPKRLYPHNDLLEPVLGFSSTTTSKPRSGLEKYYADVLAPKQNGETRAYKDIGGNIIYNKFYSHKEKIDGSDLILSVDAVLQYKINKILDKYKKELNATEILSAVMFSHNGKILAINSSNRYNPNRIQKKDIPNLKLSVIQSGFEPGSILKPIIFSILLDKNKLSLNELINGHKGIMKIGRFTIKDDHPFAWLSAENAIVYSSNIAMSQLVQRLDRFELTKSVESFGFGKKSGIDLPYELKGYIPTIRQLRSKVYKATLSYGYGLKVNFMQILKAYSAFNNNGYILTPKIADMIVNKKNEDVYIQNTNSKSVISSSTADIMLGVLRKVVLKGTGKKANVKGLFIAGKTGTAHISRKGQYEEEYTSSFFGFANDNYGHKFTIGVTVFRPQGKRYFASQTAVPIFREIVKLLVKYKYLKVNN